MAVPSNGPGRQRKVRHYDEPGDGHFLTFSCYRRMPLLGRDRSRLWHIESLQQARRKHRFDLWAWVIMLEHVHLLIWPRLRAYKTKRILADIKRPVGQKAIDWLEVLARCSWSGSRCIMRTGLTVISGSRGQDRTETSTTRRLPTKWSSTSTVTRCVTGW